MSRSYPLFTIALVFLRRRLDSLLGQSVDQSLVIVAFPGHIHCLLCLRISVQEVGLSYYWCNLFVLVLLMWHFLVIFTVCFCLRISMQMVELPSYWRNRLVLALSSWHFLVIFTVCICQMISAQEVGLSSYWCNLLALVLSLVIFIVCFCLRIFCARGWTLFLLVQLVGLSFVIVVYFLAIFTVCFCLGTSAQEVGLASYWCYCQSSFCHCCTFPGHIHCLLLSWDLCAGGWTSYWSKLLSQFAFVLGFLRRRLDSLSFGAICWSYILSMWYISWSYSLFAFVLRFLRRHCDFEKKWILKNKREPI